MNHSGVPTLWEEPEGHIQRAASARRDGTPRGRRPRARAEAPRSGTGRSRGPRRPGAPPGASESRWTHADDARPREVGPLDSTVDAAEQRRATGRGGGRGKRADQGELVRRPRRQDAVPDTRVDGPRASTSGSQPGPATAVHRDCELGARCGHLWLFDTHGSSASSSPVWRIGGGNFPRPAHLSSVSRPTLGVHHPR